VSPQAAVKAHSFEDAVGQAGEIGDLGATSRESRNWSATRNRSVPTVPFGGFAKTAN
jgi:hypothetical protein